MSDPSIKTLLIPLWFYQKAMNGLENGRYNIYFRLTLVDILVFAPLEMLLCAVSSKKSWIKLVIALLIGLCASIMIEVTQYCFKLGVFKIDDLSNNTLGSVLGAGAFLALSPIGGCRRGNNGKEIETI